MNPIRMNGIKLSQQYVQVVQSFEEDAPAGPVHLYQLLSDDRINIAFLVLDFFNSSRMIDCLVAPEHLGHVRNYPNLAGAAGALFSCETGLGTLSLYPHRYDLRSLGYILSVLGNSGFEFSRMASSPAMLTLVVDYHCQEKLAGFLAGCLDLPPTCTPFRQGPIDVENLPKKALETVAVYVEPKTKVYGIQSRSGLVLCRIDLFRDQLEAAGKRLQDLGGEGYGFKFVSVFRRPDARLRICLVVDAPPEIEPSSRLKTIFETAEVISPVALICLQGPHFGDRYGIAGQAFSALSARSVPLWIAGCAGAAIHLVVPQDALADAEAALGEVFQTP